MKISELISDLEYALKEKGDLRILFMNNHNPYSLVYETASDTEIVASNKYEDEECFLIK